jgi:hypothetical protein
LHSTTAVNSERATLKTRDSVGRRGDGVTGCRGDGATGRRGDGSTGRRGGEGALAWRDARGWSGRGGVSEEAAGGFGARRGGERRRPWFSSRSGCSLGVSLELASSTRQKSSGEWDGEGLGGS